MLKFVHRNTIGFRAYCIVQTLSLSGAKHLKASQRPVYVLHTHEHNKLTSLQFNSNFCTFNFHILHSSNFHFINIKLHDFHCFLNLSSYISSFYRARHIINIHSEQKDWKRVSWCLVNRQLSWCGFTEQIVLILSSGRNRTPTTTYTGLLCHYMYSKQFFFSSQAAAMEASSSCRPWGCGDRGRHHLFMMMMDNSVLYVDYIRSVLPWQRCAGAESASACVCWWLGSGAGWCWAAVVFGNQPSVGRSCRASAARSLGGYAAVPANTHTGIQSK